MVGTSEITFRSVWSAGLVSRTTGFWMAGTRTGETVSRGLFERREVPQNRNIPTVVEV